MNRAELKAMAKSQIKGNIGILFVCSIILSLIGGTVVGFIIVPALQLGLIVIYMGLARGKNAEIGDLFSRISLVGRALWLSIITGFFIFLWSLLFIIPGYVKTFAYSMAPYILAENPDLTAREALRRSKEMMVGHKGELFVLYLSFIGWFFLCMITLGLAGIYVGPYINATVLNFYNSIKPQPAVSDAIPVQEA